MNKQEWIATATQYMLDIKFFDRYDQAYDYAEGLYVDEYSDMDPIDAVMEDLTYYDYEG